MKLIKAVQLLLLLASALPTGGLYTVPALAAAVETSLAGTVEVAPASLETPDVVVSSNFDGCLSVEHAWQSLDLGSVLFQRSQCLQFEGVSYPELPKWVISVAPAISPLEISVVPLSGPQLASEEQSNFSPEIAASLWPSPASTVADATIQNRLNFSTFGSASKPQNGFYVIDQTILSVWIC